LFVPHLGWWKIILDIFKRNIDFFWQFITDQNSSLTSIIIFDFMNGKGKDIKNEIYNYLIICQVCDLDDVSLFNLNLFYGL